MLRRARAALWALLLVACSKPAPDSARATAKSSAEAQSKSGARAPAAPQREGALPKAPPKLLERRASCAETTCKLEQWLPDASFATSSAGVESPGAIWTQEIRDQSGVFFPRHKQLDVLAVVLEGNLVASGDAVEPARAMGRWAALYAPGAGVSLRAQRGNATAIVILTTSQATLARAFAQAKTQGWQRRPGALRTADLEVADNLGWGKGAFHARIAFGGEGQSAIGASLEVLQAKPGSAIPEHDHPSWEHIAILEGRGSFEMDGKQYAVEPGKIFHIPKRVRHAFRGAAGSPLLAVQSYTPSGEEQRFVRLAKAGSAPPPQQ